VDAFLSADAGRALRALTEFPGAKSVSGLLIGHKRAGRFFVESVFPAPSGFKPGPGNFPALNEIFGGRIIGFFVAGTGPAVRRPFLQPLACGRLLLEIGRGKSKSGAYRAFAVDYDGRFTTAPIALIHDEPPRKRPGYRRPR
jgi:hypothetical protein